MKGTIPDSYGFTYIFSHCTICGSDLDSDTDTIFVFDHGDYCEDCMKDKRDGLLKQTRSKNKAKKKVKT